MKNLAQKTAITTLMAMALTANAETANVANITHKDLDDLGKNIRMAEAPSKVNDVLAYDANKDFQNPAKNEQILTDPETKEKAKTLVAKLVEIKDYTLIKAHLAENIATLDVEVLKEAVVVLTEMQISATNLEKDARTKAIYYQNGMKRSHTYKPKYEKALKQEEEFNKEVSFLISIESFVKDAIAIKNIPTAEEMAKGVSNFAEIVSGSQLAKNIEKLQIKFKKDGEKVLVYVNNGNEDVYTNFMLFHPRYVDNYKMIADGDSAIIIEKLKLNGKTYLAKFAFEDGKTLQYGAYEGKTLHEIDSFDLSPNNLSIVKN